MIGTDTYVEFLDTEYLATYVEQGGAAVKFVVADDDQAPAFSARVAEHASARRYVVVRVDAADTRIHMMDQLFFALAPQVDWAGLANHAVRTAMAAAAHPVPEGSDDVSVGAVAAHYGVDPAELSRDVNRLLQQRVFRDFAM
ncbi:MAG: hypothetical protein M3527_06530, partial [Actinomycetota bacterium]|nr:hypothetical protein [Actinomycetota bacterium]